MDTDIQTLFSDLSGVDSFGTSKCLVQFFYNNSLDDKDIVSEVYHPIFSCTNVNGYISIDLLFDKTQIAEKAYGIIKNWLKFIKLLGPDCGRELYIEFSTNVEDIEIENIVKVLAMNPIMSAITFEDDQVNHGANVIRMVFAPDMIMSEMPEEEDEEDEVIDEDVREN